MNEATLKTIETLAEKLGGAIDALALKLGTTAEHLWGVLVRQAYVESMTNAILLIASWAAAALWTKWLLKSRRATIADGDDDWTMGQIISVTILGFYMVILLIATYGNADAIVSGFINPEFFALSKIMRGLR